MNLATAVRSCRALRGPCRVRTRLVRALRAMTVALLVVVASGTTPTFVTCVEQTRGCGETCRRCWCKRRPPGQGLRPVCACCQPQPGTQASTLLKAAVLPEELAAGSPALVLETLGWSTVSLHPIVPDVPHPPPRTSASV